MTDENDMVSNVFLLIKIKMARARGLVRVAMSAHQHSIASRNWRRRTKIRRWDRRIQLGVGARWSNDTRRGRSLEEE